VALVVRHRDRLGATGAHLLAADEERDVELARGLGAELALQRGALGALRGVGLDRLVDGDGNAEGSVGHERRSIANGGFARRVRLRPSPGARRGSSLGVRTPQPLEQPMNVRARLFVPLLASAVLLCACASSGAAPQDPAPAKEPSAQEPAKPDTAKKEAEEKEAQQKALDKKRFELECKRLEARIERLGSESSTRSAKNEVDNAEFDRNQAQRELENFQRVIRQNELDDGQLDLDRAQQRLKEQGQELDELKALYKSSDFADLTKELVMSRHTASVEFARRALALSQKGFENKRDFDLAQKEAGLTQKLERAERSLREAKARQEKGKQEIELKNKKTEHDLDELESEIKKLEEKQKAAEKPAEPMKEKS
jgi:hypothetical protein